jgi:hypothetical protein
VINTNAVKSRPGLSIVKCLRTSLIVVLILSLAGCISSTKVYQTDKTITYKGTLYNMSNVQKIDSKVMGKLPNGDEINMKGMNKKAVEALLKEDSPIMVTTALKMDDQELVYERRSVKKYSEFSKMVKNFESAGNKVSKFMAHKKQTQLKL